MDGNWIWLRELEICSLLVKNWMCVCVWDDRMGFECILMRVSGGYDLTFGFDQDDHF
jgi:hypothetical protein